MNIKGKVSTLKETFTQITNEIKKSGTLKILGLTTVAIISSSGLEANSVNFETQERSVFGNNDVKVEKSLPLEKRSKVEKSSIQELFNNIDYMVSNKIEYKDYTTANTFNDEPNYTIEEEIQHAKNVFLNVGNLESEAWYEEKQSNFKIENFNFKTKNNGLKEDMLQSSILYNYLNYHHEDNPFKDIKEDNHKISAGVRALASVRDLETKSFGHSSTVNSNTGANGTYQIIASTGTLSSSLLFIENDIPINEYELEEEFKDMSYRNRVRGMMKKTYEDYKSKTGKGWSTNYYNKKVKYLESHNRRFIYASKQNYKKNSEKGREYKEFIDGYEQNTKYSKFEELALKYNQLFIDPVNQGVFSLATLQMKYSYISDRNRNKILGKDGVENVNDKKDQAKLNKLFSNLLYKYNGDKNQATEHKGLYKYINDEGIEKSTRKHYIYKDKNNGRTYYRKIGEEVSDNYKKMQTREHYRLNGKKYFGKYLTSTGNMIKSDLEMSGASSVASLDYN